MPKFAVTSPSSLSEYSQQEIQEEISPSEYFRVTATCEIASSTILKAQRDKQAENQLLRTL